jgi:hypothetical protein
MENDMSNLEIATTTMMVLSLLWIFPLRYLKRRGSLTLRSAPAILALVIAIEVFFSTILFDLLARQYMKVSEVLWNSLVSSVIFGLLAYGGFWITIKILTPHQ